MALKRKRSDSEISASSSLLSSPTTNFMAIDSIQAPRIQTPSLFCSRTRKRYRDNRPSETDVHQHTLSILFSAQRTRPQLQSPETQQSMPVLSIPTHHESSSNQSSLHSFWSLPNARQSSPASITSSSATSLTAPLTSYFQATNCEDCDAPLGSEIDASDIDMMDIDASANGGNHACSSCGKQVCHGCAVSNLGAERRCLMCAKPKKWIGGIGWMDQD